MGLSAISDIKMKIRHILILSQILIHCSFSVVILQSTTTSTTIVSPTGAKTLISAYYNSLHKNIAGTGVQWVTSSKTTSPTRYQSLFYTSCTGNSTISITAATSFYLYLDGVYIGYGNNASKIYTFPLKFYCGSHNVTIWVYTNKGTNSGLTFSINQNQSKCYKCQATGYWSQFACACACVTNKCTCIAPKLWKDYPVCGCACPAVRFLAQSAPSNATDATPSIPVPPPVAADTKIQKQGIAAAAILPKCASPRYYSTSTCSCVCHYRYCPAGSLWNSALCYCQTIIK